MIQLYKNNEPNPFDIRLKNGKFDHKEYERLYMDEKRESHRIKPKLPMEELPTVEEIRKTVKKFVKDPQAFNATDEEGRYVNAKERELVIWYYDVLLRAGVSNDEWTEKEMVTRPITAKIKLPLANGGCELDDQVSATTEAHVLILYKARREKLMRMFCFKKAFPNDDVPTGKNNGGYIFDAEYSQARSGQKRDTNGFTEEGLAEFMTLGNKIGQLRLMDAKKEEKKKGSGFYNQLFLCMQELHAQTDKPTAKKRKADDEDAQEGQPEKKQLKMSPAEELARLNFNNYAQTITIDDSDDEEGEEATAQNAQTGEQSSNDGEEKKEDDGDGEDIEDEENTSEEEGEEEAKAPEE